MCGIAGIVLKERCKGIIPDTLEKMLSVMRYRGPDGKGFFLSGHMGIASNRLSIIDLNAHPQPLCDVRRKLWVVFNGEIYNASELRKILIEKGVHFKTETDTEVLLYAYSEWGASFVKKLNGMFAFAILDLENDMLLLARDNFGCKPLYYYDGSDAFIFASELKSIFSTHMIDKQINLKAARLYFTFRFVPGNETIYKNIKKLAPGSMLFLNLRSSRVTTTRFWNLMLSNGTGMNGITFDASACELKERIRRSVKLQLVGDVPAGVLLSGGVDSSGIAAFASEYGNFPAFNIGFHAENEFPYARVVAKKFHLDYVELLMRDSDFADIIDDYIWHIEEPIADAACLPLLFLCREASKRVKILLSGEGGDENFSGYPQYRDVMNYEEKTGEGLPASLVNAFVQFSEYYPHGQEIVGGDGGTHDPTKVLYPYFTSRNLTTLQKQSLCDLHTWLPHSLMMKADKMGMAASIESRFPYMDTSLTSFCFNLPDEFKIYKGLQKAVYKRAMKDILPKEVIHREKKGFSVPLDRILKGVLFKRLKETINACARRDWYRKGVPNRWMRDFESGYITGYQIWTLFVFELWAQRFFDRKES